MAKFNRMSTLQLINFAVFAFGLQFVDSLRLSNMSSLYKFLGASSSYLPYLGLAAPVSGLLIQPLVGQLSDDTWSRYGKRRPYIFFWGLLTFLACCAIPFATSLWLVTVVLWIIGCGINGSVEALRALTGDIVPNAQKARAFSLQTISAGIGAGIAAVLPYIFEHFGFIAGNHALALNKIPLAIKLAFIIGGIVLSATMYWTLKKAKEKIPTHGQLLAQIKKKKHKNMLRRTADFFMAIFKNIKRMPKIIKQFSIIQIFTWIGLFAVWLFFSVAIAQHIYGLPTTGADASIDARYAELLEKGTVLAGIYFGIYQFVSVGYALILPILAEKYTEKFVHGVSLIIGAAGLFAVGLTQSPVFIGVCMVAVGIMWGSIMTLPYAIISEELPHSKMGIYLGLFNISITLPQIVAGFILPPVYAYVFKHHAIYIIMFSGVLIFIGGIITLYQLVPKEISFLRIIRENA